MTEQPLQKLNFILITKFYFMKQITIINLNYTKLNYRLFIYWPNE